MYIVKEYGRLSERFDLFSSFVYNRDVIMYGRCYIDMGRAYG